MAERECLKGWIMSPSPTDGKYVPFFVNVRDKDIVWDTDNVSSVLQSIADEGDDVEVFYPSCQWKFKMLGWIVTLNQDFTYTAMRKISVGAAFTQEDTNSIRSNVYLPFETLNDENFIVQCTKMARSNDIINSSLSVLPEINNDTRVIEICMDNKDDVFIDFDTSGDYNDSYICITVTGKLKLQ